jgi:hypothetical protein
MSEMTLQALREKAASFDSTTTPEPTPSAAPATEAPAAPASETVTAAPEPSSGGQAPVAEGSTSLNDAAPQDEWKPTYKFKAADQEHELPEWMRPVVTKDTEKQVVELFQKAYGLDQVKGKLAETATKYQTLESQIKGVVGLREKDLGKFLERVGVTKEKLAGWIREQAAVETMSPEERAVYNKNRELEEEKESLSAALETLTTEYSEAAAQARAQQLDSVLAIPQVQSIIADYNYRAGDPQAFRSMVIRHGQNEALRTNGERDLSPSEAVQEVLHMLALKPSSPAPVSQPGQPQPQPTQQKVIKAPAPAVLPKVPNGTQSPTGTTVKRISDLRERAKQYSA